MSNDFIEFFYKMNKFYIKNKYIKVCEMNIEIINI